MSDQEANLEQLGFLKQVLSTVYWMLQDDGLCGQLESTLASEMTAEHETQTISDELGLKPEPHHFLGSDLEPDWPFLVFGHHDGNACAIVLGAINDLAVNHPQLSEYDHEPVGPQGESLWPFWRRYVSAAAKLRHWHLLRLKMLISQAENSLRMMAELSVIEMDDEEIQSQEVAGEEVNTVKLSEIELLARKAPSLDRDNGDWVSNKSAARIEGLKAETLSTYRKRGDSTADRRFGQDKDGRIWRREGTPGAHPWYLRRTLLAEQKNP